MGNIPYSAGKEDFERVFADCGKIEQITIPKIYQSGKPKGFAFVRFETADDVERALKKDGAVMIDREVGVRRNKGRPTGRPERQPRKVRHDSPQSKPSGCVTIFVGNLPWTT